MVDLNDGVDSVGVDVGKVRRLIALMERRGLSRLVLTEDGITVRLETAASAAGPPAILLPAEGPASLAAPAPAAFSPPDESSVPAAPPAPPGVPLLSPTTGMFYRAPAPGEPNFVEVGDTVEVGQTVGIIMAMKVMSEIPSETAGVITAIPAKDGELVQPGAPLFIINPQGTGDGG